MRRESFGMTPGFGLVGRLFTRLLWSPIPVGFNVECVPSPFDSIGMDFFAFVCGVWRVMKSPKNSSSYSTTTTLCHKFFRSLFATSDLWCFVHIILASMSDSKRRRVTVTKVEDHTEAETNVEEHLGAEENFIPYEKIGTSFTTLQ